MNTFLKTQKVKNISVQRFFIFFFWGCFQLTLPTKRLHGASVQNHFVSYKQGIIEFIVDENDQHLRKLTDRHIDSYFVVAKMAITELNKSLSYKMNDQIRLMIHSKESLATSNPTFESSLISHIYYKENLFAMKQQIRYYVARQYLQEYLGGILMREKLSPTAIKPPAWLISGFCNYFSKPISFDEFEKFSYWAKKGKFNNINYIEKEYEELFGTIVWYLFEKEKGRSINGAFWLLLKNANSFERTFFYHFEERFNVWLKKRILEIESMGFKEGKKSDLQIPLKFIDIQSVELNLDNQIFVLHRNAGRTPVVKKFDLNSLLTDENALIKNETPNDFKNDTTEIKTNQPFNSSFNCAIQLFQPIRSNLYFIVLNRIYSGSDTIFTTGIIATLDSTHTFNLSDKYKWDTGFNNKWDTIFQSKIVKESVDFRDFVLESADHFSVIRTTGNHSEVLHYLYNSSENKWNSFATGTKGYFYHQVAVKNLNQYLEYYIIDNQLHVNSLNKNSELLIRDTLQKIPYSFDLPKLDSITEVSNFWDSSKRFISPFEFNKTRINIPRKNQNLTYSSTGYKLEDFRNWQYTESSIYYLSNQELDLFYNSNIAVERLYNSPITLFYKGSFPNLLKQSSLNFLAFTNINRRRLGFQISHHYGLQNGRRVDQQIHYRIRQFTISNSNYFRNRSIRYDLGFYSDVFGKNKLHRNLEMKLLLKNHFDQIIPLNLSENSTKSTIQNTHLQTINLSIFDRFKFPISGSQLNADYLVCIENGYFRKSTDIKWISALEGKININQRYRMLNWDTRMKARYSLTKSNVFYWIMGNNGWIDPNQFDNSSGYSGQFVGRYPLQGVGGNVRGISSASRGGTSFFNIQSEISLPITSLIPSYSINGPFLKSLKFYVWGDAGLAFVHGSPFHYKNPYNTLIFSTPNYTLTATANRNPWISSRGMGLKFRVLEMDFRFEYGQGKVGNYASRQQFSISMGNIF